jgi:hypothetical protein
VREAGWFVTGRDDDPVRHMFVRLEERMDGTGTWTLELHLCADEDGRATNVYSDESDARAALDAIYRLSRQLGELPTWDPTIRQPGRWTIRTRPPTPQDLHFRERHRTHVRP